MKAFHPLRLAVVVAVVVAGVVVGGCGDVRITGALGDRTVNATGTVAAWVDSTVYVDQGDGSFSRQDRSTDATVLHIELFQAVFDPSVDFGAIAAGERAALEDDIERGDHVAIVVARGEALRDGDSIASLPSDGLPPQVLPFVDSVTITLVAPREEDDGYPEEVARAGSIVDAVFEVDSTAPVLAGTVDVDVEADDDEDSALEGSLAVSFSTELLPERTAECNFRATGQGLDPCTLAP